MHINQRNTLWRIYRTTGRREDWEKYRIQRNQVKSCIRQWENDIEEEKILILKGNVRKFYSYAWSKQHVKKSGDQVQIDDNQLAETRLETVDVLANVFGSVFVNEAHRASQGWYIRKVRRRKAESKADKKKVKEIVDEITDIKQTVDTLKSKESSANAINGLECVNWHMLQQLNNVRWKRGSTTWSQSEARWLSG